jgi:hypothetical protein
LSGTFALAFLFEGHDNLLIGARKGSPLAVGYGCGEMFLGSDAMALAPLTDIVAYLEDGDLAVVTREQIEFIDVNGARLRRGAAAAPCLSQCRDYGDRRGPAAKSREVRDRRIVGPVARLPLQKEVLPKAGCWSDRPGRSEMGASFDQSAFSAARGKIWWPSGPG